MSTVFRRMLTLCAVSALAPAALLMSGGAASAQTVEELTVTGRYGPAGREPSSLSQVVSYADLDLGTDAGRHVLKQRVKSSARYLCEKLGETSTTTLPGASCRQAAEKDAMAQADAVITGFQPRRPNWTRGTAWVPPYPAEWDR
jgi:UrcA family protein